MPQSSPPDVADFISRNWDLRGHTTRLAGERDENHFIDAGSEGRWVLKIAPASESWQLLESQAIALEHLDGNLPVPRLRRTATGERLARIERPGDHRWARVMSWLDGCTLASTNAHPAILLRAVGRTLGDIDRALASLDTTAYQRDFKWNPSQGHGFCRSAIDSLTAQRRDLVERNLVRAESDTTALRQSVVHGDANDHNVLVALPSFGKPRVTGLIDFGDLMTTWTIADAAIACTYAMMNKGDPLAAAAHVIAGYHASYPIEATELEHILPFILLRLCTSVTASSLALRDDPDNRYLQISAGPAWTLLETLNKLPAEKFTEHMMRATRTLQARRERVLAPSLSLSYDAPLEITKGQGQWLIDTDGGRHLDCVNNVCHVGHCHPHVVAAGQRQIAELNTNTRYLHPTIIAYAERLTDLLPPGLDVCFFVNSGSEATELALRLARNFTHANGTVALEAGYHGNTQGAIDVSSYKFDRPGGRGSPPHVFTALLPDPFRGPHTGPNSGPAYAASVADAAKEAARSEFGLAAFIAEAMPGCGGQILPPPNYLAPAYDAVRAHGGLCIADEVQTGFGRPGTRFWAFELQDVQPDIVTLGKPMGNGHPIGAVVTTRPIAEAFDNGMEYFNTFGGNPVSCAIAMAVLDVIENENLQTHASAVGEYLMKSLRQLQARHAPIADVRGSGLYIGVELLDKAQLPAAALARTIVNQMRNRHILLSTDGPNENVLKIKPPLVFDRDNADHLIRTLDEVLNTLRI